MTKAFDKPRYLPGSEQPVILEKPILLSSLFMWTIVGIVTGLVTWASFAQIDQSIPAAGKLEPDGPVKDVQAPVGGVVKELKVKENEVVKAGQVLMTLETRVTEAEKRALTKAKAALEAQISFYEAQLNGGSLSAMASDPGTDFIATQEKLLTASLVERQTRRAATEQEIAQLRAQLDQAQQQLRRAQEILLANEGILSQTETILKKSEETLEAMRPVKDSGALSRLQFDRQDIEVESRRAEVLSRRSQITSIQADIDRLTREETRLLAAIAQAEERLGNAIAQTERDILERIAANQQRLNEVNAQLERADQTLKYQEIKAPISGSVFNIKVTGNGFVIPQNSAEPLMKIVPNDKLVAKVYITNRDIGFINKRLESKEPIPVDVKVDSFPNLEFGSIKGKVEWVGSDALPPIQERPFYAFPAKIVLEQQVLRSGDCDNPAKKNDCIILPLQAGMSVNTNIKTRKRSVMSIFLSQFIGKAKSLENVR
ncbi:MAG: HlyD family type I secretion periplasmic adaptor subunit [Cyanobacteria bacterium M5B4]|nr:MAG: HlyD family type I secretion periplasmic adaptor subunit [Cyanobacteria bacterium M5B4]